jgi:hypothetical protein
MNLDNYLPGLALAACICAYIALQNTSFEPSIQLVILNGIAAFKNNSHKIRDFGKHRNF